MDNLIHITGSDTTNPIMDNTIPLLTADEVAELLKIDPSSVRRMAREGKIPSVKFGRTVRIRRIDLDMFIAEHLTA